MPVHHVLVPQAGKDNGAEASEGHCSKVNQPDSRQEKSNNGKDVLLLVSYTPETQIMDFVYKNEAIIFHKP